MFSSILDRANQITRQPHRLALMIALYILVVFYSVSHSHPQPDEHTSANHITQLHPQDFSPGVLALSQQSAIDGQSEHWHADQHHSASCQLTAQAPPDSSIPGLSQQVHTLTRAALTESATPTPTPTSQRTRAPPVLLV